MVEKNADRILDLLLSQLDKLNQNQDKLVEQIGKINIELVKVAGCKSSIENLNTWKEDRDKVVNIDDLRHIKEFYSKNQDIDADISDIYLIIKELRAEIEDYKKFKIKTMTVIAVVSFLFTLSMTILSWLIH